MPKPLKSQRTRKDVRELRFTKRLRNIGEGAYGEVFVGSLEFKHHVPKQTVSGKFMRTGHRVAIKRFRDKVSSREVAKYTRVIANLRVAGVRLPKMDFVKLKKGTKVGDAVLEEDEWVQVSQLFGSSKKGTKVNRYFKLKSVVARNEAVIELTKIANAGYVPASDCIEVWKDGLRVISLDIDSPVFLRKQSFSQRAKKLAEQIGSMTQDVEETQDRTHSAITFRGLPDASKGEFLKLMRLAIRNANTLELKNALRIELTKWFQ